MKILLIKPYWRVAHQAITPPLGIMYLAAFIRERLKPRPEVFIIDQSAAQTTASELESFLLRERPEVIGITGLTYEGPGVKLLAALCKRVLPDSTVIVGGPHATVFYDHLLDNTEADIAVLGEGEQTLLELTERARDGIDWRDVPGIAYRGADGKIAKTAPRDPIADLDSMPFPAWDLVDIPAYANFGDMNGYIKSWPYMFTFTSRACPYGCIYCHQIFGKKFRARSAESSVEEIKRLVRDHGVKEIHIIDDIFNWDLDRAKNICRGIINEGIKVNIAFPNGLRGDRIDAELIELLAKAGTYSITFAIETTSPRLQKLIHKNANLERINWAIDKSFEEGMIPMGFFMLGFPTETREEMEDTISFARNSKLLKAVFFSVVPFPRTKLFELFKETYPAEFNLDEYDLDNMHYFPTNSFFKTVTGIDLEAAVRHAYRSFYLKPNRIVEILRRFTWNRKLLRGFYLGFRISWPGGRKLELLYSKLERRRLGMKDGRK